MFSPHTLKWWQVAIFKIALLTLGASAGIYWYVALAPYLAPIFWVGVVCALYIMWMWFKR